MDNIQNLLNKLIKNGNSFGECVKSLMSLGYSKSLAETEVKKAFTIPEQVLPPDLPDDIEIDIKKRV